MPKKLKNPKIPCRYFTWRLYRRPNGVYYADGRITKSDQPALGRQSLGTTDHDEAMRELSKLDLVMAVKHGRADRSALNAAQTKTLPLADGVKVYLDHVKRPDVAGGKPNAPKRYKTVFDKFTEFLANIGLDAWQQIDRRHLDKYAAWLDKKDYAFRTMYLELTVIKQALNHLVDEKLLPESSRFDYPLTKPGETSTYCYSREQVDAMIVHCRGCEHLHWLTPVLIALAYTGLRISELAGVRWSDLEDNGQFLRLSDRSRQGNRTQRASARSTKGKRGRVVPVHP